MSAHTNHHEKSLVILKPDSIQRGLVGDIIGRFEKKGLKMIAMKMVWPTEKQARSHYDWSDEEMTASGERTIEGYKKRGIEIKEKPIEIGRKTQRKLLSYMTTGPVIVMVIEGAHAIASVRKIRGGTNPLDADIGSITADLAMDSYQIADDVDRAVRNLVHASGNTDEADREIAIWFSTSEILNYDLLLEKVLYKKDWEDEKSII